MKKANIQKSKPEECRTCKFFLKMDPKYDTVPAGAGFCRRNPPTLVHCTTGERFDTAFPCVSEGEWCGEWIEAS